MVTSSTVAEPAVGETAWVSAATYVAGDRRIRSTTHKMYECIAEHTGITTLPEDDPNRWVAIKPTQKWAMFDTSVSTQTTATTTLSVVITPGFFNTFKFYGFSGGTLDWTYKDAPAGTVMDSGTVSLIGPYDDEYDWMWGPYRTKDKLTISNLIPYATAELSITLSASSGTTVGIGMMAIGDERPLFIGDWGGTQYGAEANPVDFSYIALDQFGAATIVKRHSATDLTLSAAMPASSASYALKVIQEVLAVPAAFRATTVDGYDYLDVFGLASASLRAEGPSHATMQIKVKGLT
jgi:hypothetical protein